MLAAYGDKRDALLGDVAVSALDVVIDVCCLMSLLVFETLALLRFLLLMLLCLFYLMLMLLM